MMIKLNLYFISAMYSFHCETSLAVNLSRHDLIPNLEYKPKLFYTSRNIYY